MTKLYARARNGSGYWLKASWTMRYTCSIPRASLLAGTRVHNASRVTLERKSSEDTFRASILQKTWMRANPGRYSQQQCATDTSQKKAGGLERTESAFGRK